MKPLKEYDSESILSEEVFTELFEEPDRIQQARLILSLEERAKELGVKQKFSTLIKAYEKTYKEIEKDSEKKNPVYVGVVDGVTNFTFGKDCSYQNMRCGSWQASDNGVYAPISTPPYQIMACYHPILPVERLCNIETGEEQIVLAFKRNHRWKEIKVPKDIISSSNKIVGLSKVGVSVTSESAKHLVKYLSDVENYNEDDISIQQSTSKLGWRGQDFIPYDTEIIFDGDSRFRALFDAIHENGTYEKWLETVKEIRASKRIESRFMLAASFSSVLVKMLGTLPYFVDLWGETEGGKSVSLMLAASVWANPDESQYIGDFKTTDVALEAKADMLNNLPMMLDDTSKTSSRVRDNFEGIVYDLCSGKGKSRSNKELGINRENRWSLCILTNGEKSLDSYVNQGGAINRILEIECGSNVYQDPQQTATLLKQNYGFAGKKFIEILKDLGIDEVKKIYKDFCKQLFDSDKMQKQAMSLAVVLTADKIATEYIFKDGMNITLDEARKTLVDRNALSDNERCYQYLLDKISMNSIKFDDVTNCEKWGVIDEENGISCAFFFTQAFDDLCKQGGFGKKAFLSWADKNKVIISDSGRTTKVKKIDSKPKRCICLKLERFEEEFSQEIDEDDNPFQ